MFDYLLSPSNALDIVHHVDKAMLDDSKRNSSSLFIRQPYTVQIIQLVEGPPPPPRRPILDLNESFSLDSSSQCSSSSEEESEASSSYCSSEGPAEDAALDKEQAFQPEASPDTYSLRMKRILAWRENFSAHLGATMSEPSLSSTLKRKLQCDEDAAESDVSSRSSKRSRSQASSQCEDSAESSLGDHSCPACDACFDSEQSLRRHGLDAGANEACFVAVEYAFE
ncbi:hypothetical protein C8J56DRAFT_941231 [Mycena floridula]|nr:hypothetical protein C8J56DRAFT_941231 [Mycena floridula]